MYKNPVIQRLCNPLHESRGIIADVLRLDLVHPVISGNKWFKLKYYLDNASKLNYHGIVSFGGAYSNHLLALAYACREKNIRSAAIIRGESDGHNNSTLADMKALGMEMHFVSREKYRDKISLAETFRETHPEYLVVPEGGQGEEGIKGAAEILTDVPRHYTHIICSVGTGTTLAGIISASHDNQQVIGISALKVEDEKNNELLRFLQEHTNKKNYQLLFQFHFGGYARRNKELINFMNEYFNREKIPTDFVYTAKMFYAVEELIRTNYFPSGSHLLLIHTGGLQGNRSLAEGELLF